MYLWDANILRHFGQGRATLRLYLLRVPWAEIALPSVVVAAVLRGRVRLPCRRHRRKRYADLRIAAMVIAGQHILVTRNHADFVDVLPATQLANWMDDPPGAS